MSAVQTIRISADEGDQRIDRWLKKKFPQLTQGAVEKMCRTGQLRVDGGRVKANTRIEVGQEVRVPPLPQGEAPPAGQHVVHDIDDLVLPYLPDPLARGVSLVFPDATTDPTLPIPFGIEGFTTSAGV